MGANAHIKVSEYIDQLNSNTVFLEIGLDIEPWVSGSTAQIFNLAKSFGVPMYAVDTSEKTFSEIEKYLPEVYSDPDFYHVLQHGEDFLNDFHKWEHPKNRKISYAYLDNFDWMYQPERYWRDQEPSEQHDQYLRYKDNGIELTNTNSDIAHLKQTMLVEKHSDEKCIITFDDTWFFYEHDCYIGKGMSSIIYLLSKGWKVLPFTRDDLMYGEMAIMVGKNIIPNKEGTIH